jgi:pyrimidine operon attenuation protein/uracil phosphoribosyltransferase
MIIQPKPQFRVMEAAAIKNALADMADQIAKAHEDRLSQVAFVGIRTRGVHLAHRLARHILDTHQTTVPCASMDVTLYRDDVGDRFPPLSAGPTSIEFDVTDTVIVIVDDVLFKGRTIRAALDHVIDFGRPAKIELAVLVDRGHRELPIQPDYVGAQIETNLDETVRVSLTEEDGIDHVEVVGGDEGDANTDK